MNEIIKIFIVLLIALYLYGALQVIYYAEFEAPAGLMKVASRILEFTFALPLTVVLVISAFIGNLIILISRYHKDKH
jgi:hypothetical protein